MHNIIIFVIIIIIIIIINKFVYSECAGSNRLNWITAGYHNYKIDGSVIQRRKWLGYILKEGTTSV